MPSLYHSICQYETDEQLAKALRNDDGISRPPEAYNRMTTSVSDSVPCQRTDPEWTIYPYDSKVTETQTMKEELKRLQVIKRYMILDADREEELDRLAKMAGRVFDIPTATINVVDIGRFFIVASHGVPLEIRETPRKDSICSHTVWMKLKKTGTNVSSGDSEARNDVTPMLIVPDANLDFRFQSSRFVCGVPYVRFYAGVPLISPEGYTIGTFCLIDYKARPNGLTESEQKIFSDFASLAMQLIANRRFRVEATENNSAKLLASTRHDLITPLTGVELCMSLLNDDNELKELLGEPHLKLLNSAASCSDIAARVCRASFERTHRGNSNERPSLDQKANESLSLASLDDFVKRLQIVTDTMKTNAPISIRLDDNVPRAVNLDETKLFRSALNLVNHAVAHNTGNAGNIQLHIFTKTTYSSNSMSTTLMFECRYIAAVKEPYMSYLKHFSSKNGSESCLPYQLQSIRLLVNSLKGRYGYRLLKMDDAIEGASYVIWFSIPLEVTDDLKALPIPNSIDISIRGQHRSPVNIDIQSKDGTIDTSCLKSTKNEIFSRFSLNKYSCLRKIKRESSSDLHDTKRPLFKKGKQCVSAPLLKRITDPQKITPLHNFQWPLKPKDVVAGNTLSLKSMIGNDVTQLRDLTHAKRLRFA